MGRSRTRGKRSAAQGDSRSPSVARPMGWDGMGINDYARGKRSAAQGDSRGRWDGMGWDSMGWGSVDERSETVDKYKYKYSEECISDAPGYGEQYSRSHRPDCGEIELGEFGECK